MTEERAGELTEDLPEIARHTSERERRADDAERELVQWKKVRFMADKVGDEFDGYITGVSAFGLYIELVEHFVEGHGARLDDGRRLLPLRREGARAEGREHRQGLPARRPRAVQVVKVDMERRQVDLGLTEILDAVRASERNRGPRRSKAEPQPRAQALRAIPKPRKGANGAKPRPGKKERASQTEAMSGRSIVIGTAGHIDHGKSALVRALTGIDPDRLKEEQARGITIDLGFAHLRAGVRRSRSSTCPGHERFVKNMLAGAGGIDLVVLVVAADESVMPQTREHFDICRLLDVPRRRDRPHQVRRRRSGHAGAGGARSARADGRVVSRRRAARPRVCVEPEGLEELTADARRSVVARPAAGRDDRPARLPIDRVFTVKGFGTVVTGTLVAGRACRGRGAGACCRGGLPVKARGLQVHGAPGPTAGRGRARGGQSRRRGRRGLLARRHAVRARLDRADAPHRRRARPAAGTRVR